MWFALKITLLQALFSGAASTVLGFLLALGLNSEQHPERRRFLSAALILPTFLPTIFSLSICLRLLSPFPFGLWGIVIVNTFINAGFVGFLWSKELVESLSGAEELSQIEGASRFLFWRTCWPVIWHQSWRYFFLVFIFCIPSFTIPLVVGGPQGTSLEVLIYEKIRSEGNFYEAFQISLLQSLILTLTSFYMIRSNRHLTLFGRKSFAETHPYLGSRILAWFFMGVAWILVSIFVWELFGGLQEFGRIPGLGVEIFELVINSLIVVGFSIFFSTGLFMIQLWLGPRAKLQKIMSGYFSLSPALIGFLVLLMGGEGSFWYLALAMTLIFYTAAWRVFGYPRLIELSPQIETAEILGASQYLIFKQISFPQMLESWADMMGVFSLWCLGEFAVAKLVMAQEMTLGILAGNLMSSYRLRSAFVVTALILLLGALVWLALRRLARVLNTKLI